MALTQLAQDADTQEGVFCIERWTFRKSSSSMFY